MTRVFSRLSLFLSLVFFALFFLTVLLFTGLDVTSWFFLAAGFIFFILFYVLDFTYLWGRTCDMAPLFYSKKNIFTFLVLLLTVGLNVTAYYFPLKWDWSANGLHTLSPLSKKVARSFTEPIEFLYFYVPNSEARDQEDQISIVIKKYQDENALIRLRKINVLQEPGEAKKFRLNNQEQGLFVKYKERYERFFKTDENSLTQALLKVTRPKKVIYFTSGAGESSAEDDKGKGLTELTEQLSRLFYSVRAIDLDSEAFSDEAAAIVVMGAERPFSEKKIQKLLEYFNKGGRIFIAVDPMTDPQTQLLKAFGVKTKKGFVHMQGGAFASAGSHMVSGLLVKDKISFLQGMDTNSVTLFYITSALEPDSSESKYIYTPLMTTPENAVLRSGLTKSDAILETGPFTLLALVQKKDQLGRVLISGDADLFSNQFIYQHLNPSVMFMVFSYLTKDEDLLLPPAQKSSDEKFYITDTSYKLYLAFVILPLPAFFFIMSAFLWLRRRRG